LNVQVLQRNPSTTPGAAGAPRPLQVTIARSTEGARTSFEVSVPQPAVVLDVLLALQRHDPSLGFRYSCRVSMCGTCALRVDGRPALACQTPIPSTAEELVLEPLAGLPIIRDLIVDMAPFWDEWRRLTPWFVPAEGEPRTLAADDASRTAVETGLDCISCGACWSACDLAGGAHGFRGPAALNRAMVLVADDRDGARDARLRAVSESGGVTSCHYIHGCSGACPKGIDPAASIRRLRRWSISAPR
jgi:succinate dehydrogenase/fumarate reductase iron-sulfur protein